MGSKQALFVFVILAAVGCGEKHPNGSPGDNSTPKEVSVQGSVRANTEVLKRLQSEPVSVLDFGLEMMWRDLTDTAKDRTLDYYGRDGAFPADIAMTYDSTEGKIWIAIESNPGTEVTQSDTSTLRQRAGESLAEGWCKTLINKLRVELATGYPDHPPRWLRYFVHGYGHSAFANLPNPPELVQLNKILPKLFLLRAHAADDSVSIICTGPLIGSEISIEREPLRIVE